MPPPTAEHRIDPWGQAGRLTLAPGVCLGLGAPRLKAGRTIRVARNNRRGALYTHPLRFSGEMGDVAHTSSVPQPQGAGPKSGYEKSWYGCVSKARAQGSRSGTCNGLRPRSIIEMPPTERPRMRL